ncbi:PREDICTED: FAD-linked sulfhydryl oxidase ERV1 isoform X2 [Nelumbo nucifera]|uniref:Sulfhydryl oxidase n=1 Tax=Nelumbo nucifera TaxID=4432 RepID=A0A1U7ZWF1_NELNU|nr:PREDICTED: FAD-linked sulfhydryl oxidase ERV1 isoform X2 [Nelumbo nucifera]
MSDNQLLQLIFKACDNFAQCIQTHFSHFIGNAIHSSPVNQRPLFSLNSSPSSKILEKNDGSKLLQRREDLTQEQTKPLTKEELGRATWTLLHMVAAQYPDHPTKQQKRDVKELMAILSRIYPCRDCADHFKEVLRASPVQAESQAEFSQWLCHVHNVVNRSLGKPIFPCRRVDARWGKLDCKERTCDVQGVTTEFD